jgi:regulator of nucleoside diphosphate kinase
MNPTLLTLLIATGVGLCALLIVASGLIHTSLRRRKAVAAGGRNIPSRILDDLRPVEDLLVDFVRYSPELASVLAVLAPIKAPARFARIVHEIRIGRPDRAAAGNLVGAALSILFVAGLLRLTRDGFVATEAGREVQGRINSALPPVGESIHALAEQQTRANPQMPSAAETHQLSHLHRTALSKEANSAKSNKRNIIMTVADLAEINFAIAAFHKLSERGRAKTKALRSELARAEIVGLGDLPRDVITMNSCAQLLDLDTNEQMEFTLVFPRDANLEKGKMSVLAPLGTAMLGYRVGDEFEWIVPYGLRRLKVTAVRFQPESALAMAA